MAGSGYRSMADRTPSFVEQIAHVRQDARRGIGVVEQPGRGAREMRLDVERTPSVCWRAAAVRMPAASKNPVA